MAFERFIDAFEDEVRVVATLDIGTMWERFKREFLGEWEKGKREGLSAAALDARMESFLENLSPSPEKELARASTTIAYNQGRNAELLSARTARGLQFVVRSEVLDTNTCRPCALLDSEIFAIDTPEYFANQPPAQCSGGSRCRGFYIPIGSP